MSLYLILMGVQGSGKGTQAAFIKEQYNIPHVSTGDLFRAMRTREDELAKRIQETMARGFLVDDDTTNEVVKERLSLPDAANGAILDGYPRTPEQAEWLEDFLKEKGEGIKVVILFELDFYTAFKRAFGRVKTQDEKDTFNIYYDADKLDFQFAKHPDKAYPPRLEASLKATGEVLKRRPDDEAAGVVERIDTFERITAALIEYYEPKGVLERVNAKQSIEAVWRDVKAIIDQKLKR